MTRAEQDRDALLDQLEGIRDAIAGLDKERAPLIVKRAELVRTIRHLPDDVKPSSRTVARAAGISNPWVLKLEGAPG